MDAASWNLYIVGVLRLRNYQFAHPPWYSKLGDHMGITVIVLSEVFWPGGLFPARAARSWSVVFVQLSMNHGTNFV